MMAGIHLVPGVKESRFGFLVEAFGLNFMEDGHASSLLMYMGRQHTGSYRKRLWVRYLALP